VRELELVVCSRHCCHGYNCPGDESASNVDFEGIMAQWLRRSQSGFSRTRRQLW
jgi:hypothetical protein